MMKVLVACEYSGTVRDAFLAQGHIAVSCDILPCESELKNLEHLPHGGHYQGDIFDILYDGWDLMIAHPPCTYLSKAGARWLYPTAGNLCPDRFKLGLEGKAFFMRLLEAPIKYIAVENPTPLKAFELPVYSQAVQPYQFGHPYSKRTLLWLKNLPELTYTQVIEDFTTYLPSNTGGKKRGQKHSRGISKNAHESSKTFKGIALAMADQWGGF